MVPDELSRRPSNDPNIAAPPFRGVVAIGASAGGVHALQHFARHIPDPFDAPILVVQHIGPHPSILPGLMQRAGAISAAHARDGEPLQAGRVYLAPPDHHMLVERDAIRLTRAAKEHHTRPAIDPLMRSVALAYGPRAIGVVMSGWGDDGTAGLQAIKGRGGTALVQNPADAEHPSMPMSALQYVAVDETFDVRELGAKLQQALARDHSHVRAASDDAIVKHEQQIFLAQGDFMQHLSAIGRPSSFVCPDCNGGLWEIHGARPRRFRCHTGHAYTLRSLQEAQAEVSDTALWNAMRGVEEKEMLLREVAGQLLQEGNAEEAARMHVLAHAVASHASVLRGLAEREEPPQAATGSE